MSEFHKPQIGDLCPYCRKGELVLRTSRYGQFLGCNQYPKCAGKINLKDDDNLENQADKWLEGWGR